ncbi:MAG: threonylcarbamoyl-AMP synthase [Candidatus Aenigmarchaeota archaeon]|nr:threonylcarbamoyl-AMP synthase [Candidatus Aenigmarchaeota archaeon]
MEIEIKKSSKKIIKKTLDVLNKGGLVIYPTETCYGIGADATNKEAIQKLLNYKTKREGKAISIAVADKKMAKKYVILNEIAENLYDHYLPGPLTIVSKSKGSVANGIEAGDKTIGVRIPKYPLVLKLIKKFGKPITATSANASYKKTPYSVKDILDNTSKKQQSLIDLIIDAGELPKNKPSTILNTTLNEIKFLREGDIIFRKSKIETTKSEEETKQLAKKILKENRDNKALVFALQGELGTGKTQFTKGLAEQMKIKRNIISPTFVLLREYNIDSKSKLYHIDAYRMFDEKELNDLNFESMLGNGNVLSIEWADKVSKIIKRIRNKARVIWVKFQYVSENRRRIEYSNEFI